MFVSTTSSRHLQDMSSRYVFKTSSRRHQRNNFSSSKTCSRRIQDILKTSSKCLARQKIVTLKTYWTRLQDVLKTNKCLLGLYVPFNSSFISTQFLVLNLDSSFCVLSNKFIIFWYSIIIIYYSINRKSSMISPLCSKDIYLPLSISLVDFCESLIFSSSFVTELLEWNI